MNNIRFFLKGKLSQWHGGFPSHYAEPIKIPIWNFSKFFKYHPSANYHANLPHFYAHYDCQDCSGFIEFSCTEQAMMFAKSVIFGDFETSEKILEETHPLKMQQLGRTVKGFTHDYWNSIKFDLLYMINMEKFSKDDSLKEYLLSTGHLILAENSTDLIYGIGLVDEDDSSKWTGENLLGRILMKIREDLKNM